jgi:hypothetical protein
MDEERDTENEQGDDASAAEREQRAQEGRLQQVEEEESQEGA